MAECTHLDHVRITQLPEAVDGCEDCLAIGDPWLHLRICLECGHVGCCDDSPNRHATAHARQHSHPIIRSLEPEEDWSWCYVDELAMRILGVEGRTRIPPCPSCSQVRSPAEDALSERELEVLRLVARGASNRDAAGRLLISEATVKTHLLHIYAKLRVNDAAAVAEAYNRGLLAAEPR